MGFDPKSPFINETVSLGITAITLDFNFTFHHSPLTVRHQRVFLTPPALYSRFLAIGQALSKVSER
jgi:hypothetical protein